MKNVLLRPVVVAVAVVALASSAWAESVPSFALEYAKEKATHVVVVGADGAVLESWRGDLVKGTPLPFKAGKKPIGVVNPFPREPRDPKVASVTGSRRVLFLIRAKTGNSWTPAGYLLPEERFATVWIEEGHCFAIYQFVNPGHGAMMHPLYMDEPRLKQEVVGGKHKAKGAKAAAEDPPKDSVGPKDKSTTKEIRRVTFRAHLPKGKLAEEPQVRPAETILVVPDPAEPFLAHKPLKVTLPNKIPYAGKEELYYLIGYAVGRSGVFNGQPKAHSNVTEARRHKSWNDGWQDGWEAGLPSAK